jgi:hypothetical protein
MVVKTTNSCPPVSVTDGMKLKLLLFLASVPDVFGRPLSHFSHTKESVIAVG